MVRRLLKTFLILSVLSFVLFGFYIYKLHALAVEGNNLFEYRCLYVNPPLIAYKIAFLKYADFVNTFEDPKYTNEEIATFVQDYISGMRRYVPEETKWLEMQKKFMDRWDFRLVEPWYVKEAGNYQWKMYEGYRDDAKLMLATLENPEPVKDIKPGYTSEERSRRDFYRDKYFNFFDEALKIPDWRKFFGSVPVPKGCTEENTVIPETAGSINWGIDEPEATPPGVPIDPLAIPS